MKNQKKDRKVSPAELLKQIDTLQKELFTTNVQFELFVGLKKSGPGYKDEFNLSPRFWSYTFDAHINMVVLRLCRIYDADEKTMSLPKFLRTVEENSDQFNEKAYRERNKDHPMVGRLATYQRSFDSEQLEKDKIFCSNKNPIVKQLFIWRNNIVAHFNYEEAFGKKMEFHKRYPLLFRDIEELIKSGLKIVNYYGHLFGEADMPESNSTNYPVNDFQIILDLLWAHCERNFRQQKTELL